MRLKLIVVGKTKEKYIHLGEMDFAARLNNYCEFEQVIVRDERITASRREGAIKMQEGERILQKLGPSDLVVVLDQRGEQVSSERLAGFIDQERNRGTKQIDFIIGGALGLGENVLARADKILSLSAMTFTHEMARLIVLEQLYRAHSILAGTKYHK
ncbi:MAG: 23S rRNA (pseudouridine(1915)-N(3))-methyltransferase RlmH [Candidatus Zhuqueibacterota bacterium]